MISKDDIIRSQEKKITELRGENEQLKFAFDLLEHSEQTLKQENERLRSENETLVNNIVKIGDIAQEQDEYVERLRGLLKRAKNILPPGHRKLAEEIEKELEDK